MKVAQKNVFCCELCLSALAPDNDILNPALYSDVPWIITGYMRWFSVIPPWNRPRVAVRNSVFTLTPDTVS